MRYLRWTHGWLGPIFASTIFAVLGGQAAPSPRIQDLAGVWDLSIEDTSANCRIALHAAQSDAGHRQVTIPLACLKAFPDLAPVGAWALTDDGHLDLVNSEGETVLDFAATDAAAFIANGPRGAGLRLTAVHNAPEKNDLAVHQGDSREIVAEKQDAPASAGAAGRYSILRDGSKDTGCMLTLDNRAKASGGGKASLAPGCRDQGIVIFDPAGWQIVNGRLVLTARRGHQTHLDAQPDGTWKKDPKEGKSLTLKKL